MSIGIPNERTSRSNRTISACRSGTSRSITRKSRSLSGPASPRACEPNSTTRAGELAASAIRRPASSIRSLETIRTRTVQRAPAGFDHRAVPERREPRRGGALFSYTQRVVEQGLCILSYREDVAAIEKTGRRPCRVASPTAARSHGATPRGPLRNGGGRIWCARFVHERGPQPWQLRPGAKRKPRICRAFS